MDEKQLRAFVGRVKSGKVSRRRFIATLGALGLSAPLATQILMHSGVASAANRPVYKPTKRGGGGTLKLLMWQAPTLLNPHFALGAKDNYGSRLFYEPLAEWDAEANLMPILAAEIPSIAAGTASRDGLWVVWKLKKNVKWHDGTAFTADDVVFNWEYATDPATSASTSGLYRNLRAERIDSHTVRIVFAKPTPFWADPFCATRGMQIPKHLFQAYKGAKSRDAPGNLKPVGTGPYKFVDFKPGDAVRGVINADYHEPNRPHFDAFELKGGGDSVSAARAVLQTGEYDFAWGLAVEDEILTRLEQGGKGRVVIIPAGSIEHIQLNPTDPWTEVDGARSSMKTRHPAFSDAKVREAFGLLVDRRSIQEHIYGKTGSLTANFLNMPERFRSANLKWEFNPDKASQVLDAALWKRGSDGVRAKDGRKLKFLFQTSTNAPRQKTQAVIKQACQKAGIDLELKAVASSVYFSSDVANPDTNTKFYADIQMYMWTQGPPDPDQFMNTFCSWEIPTKENQWSGRNAARWSSDEYDALYKAAATEMDPVKRAAMYIRMNDLVVGSGYIIPLVQRPTVHAFARKVQAPLSPWTTAFSLLQDWYREA
jgi:peptide/nickel transport system substrate-binding protein